MFKTKTLNQSAKPKERYLQVFLIAAVTAALFFLPFIIMDKGLFLFYGDYNVQQIPFYKLAHEAVRSGNIFWSQYTDLGANFIGSYSFYLLGSPFFWLTIPFPTAWVPYLMAPLFVLKFSCSAVTAYAFIRRFVKTSNMALLGGLIYSFCGFNIYNIFFNHFQEAVVFFPLLLVALEEFVINRRRGVFALTVCLCAVVNYFFFFGEVIFLFIYFFVRCLDKDFTIDLKSFLLLALESVLGLLCAMFLLLPSALAITGNGRLDDMLAGWNFLLYGDVQRYPLILESFFLPPDIPARPNFFPDSNAKWSSVAGYLPMFSFAGVIAFLKSKKAHWASRVTKICIVMAFIPGLNSIFTMFNYSYYARWFFMPLLIMALMTVMALEGRKCNFLDGMKWTAVIIGVFSLIGIIPSSWQQNEEAKNVPAKETALIYLGIFLVFLSIAILLYTISSLKARNEKVKQNLPIFTLATAVAGITGMIPLAAYSESIPKVGNFLPPFPERFWAYIVIGVIGLAIAAYVISLPRKKERFMRAAAFGICFVTVAYAVVFIAFGKSHSYTYYDVVTQGLEGRETIQLPDDEFYRVDVYDGMDNYPMFWKMPTIQAFHSIVPASVLEFYPSIGVERGVGSRPELKFYGLRGLTSVKYLLTDNTSTEPYIPGFEKIDNQTGFDIYENKNFIPMGFTYDQYITQTTFDDTTKEERDRLLLEGILLSEEQIEKYGQYFTELSYGDVPYFSDDELAEVCKARNQETCTDFTTDNKGFSAVITPAKDNLVFFSVPYDEGWTATVNGKPVEIEKVNVGFMAVPVEGGKENVIRFHYMTPGLKIGIAVSAGAFLLLLVYYLMIRYLRKKNPEKYGVRKYAHLRFTDTTEEIKAERAYTYSVLNTCQTLSAAIPEEILKQQADMPENSHSAEPSEQTDDTLGENENIKENDNTSPDKEDEKTEE